MILDFACTRSNTFLALLALDKIEHVSLAIGQHLREKMQQDRLSASSNERVSPAGSGNRESLKRRSFHRRNNARRRSDLYFKSALLQVIAEIQHGATNK